MVWGRLTGPVRFCLRALPPAPRAEEDWIDCNDRMRFSNRMRFLSAAALGIVADVFAMGDASSARMQQAHVAAFAGAPQHCFSLPEMH